MDENTIWLIAATVIAALIGAIVGAMISGWMTDNTNMKILQIQQKNELKALANEFLNDLNFIEMSEKEFENYKSNPTSPYNDPKSPRYHSTLSWQDPIYPSWGMYYSNRQDLSKFDSNLSKKLIAFYGLVLTAESQREQYNNYDTLYPRDKNDSYLEENRKSNLLRIFNNMENNIIQSRSQR
ncbi:MAG: hypothetical protein M0Q92_13090 [Methanoregula sp.]|jgi:hypothetical protein|nr:hypothetical protein [Methanoregula sp.]